MNKISRREVRKAILYIEKPFYISDLLSHLAKQGIEDSELVIQVLDELFAEGMIEYRKLDNILNAQNNDDDFAFAVAC